MNKICILLSLNLLISGLLLAQAPAIHKDFNGQYPVLKDIERRTDKSLRTIFPYNIVLQDTAGNYFSSEHALTTKDKPLVLLFWMTTCGPCRLELDAIKTQFDSWKKEVDFRLLAVSMDFPDRYPNYVERVKKENWPFETVFDVHRQFCDVMPNGGLNGLPQLFVMSEKGEVLYYHRRYIQGDEAELFTVLKKLKGRG